NGVAKVMAARTTMTPAVADSASRVLGLWGDETTFGPAVDGTLTIDGRNAEWVALIDGFEAAVNRRGSAVTFTVPGDQGTFRGRVDANAGAIKGFWVQPAGLIRNNAYATPVTLVAASPKIWIGTVRPLPDRISMYLQTSRAPDGTVSAFMRNPEFNFMRRKTYIVTVDGDKVLLTNRSKPEDRLRGSLDNETGQLRMEVEDIGVFDFTQRDRNHASGFYPETVQTSGSGIREPVAIDDGWSTASLTDSGMDPAPIEALSKHLDDTVVADSSTPRVQGIAIARHGKLVFEKYFYGFDRERTHDTRSAGKTFAPLLVGLAIEHGAKFTIKTPVAQVFPGPANARYADARKRRITVENLMTMTSGLACDDGDSDSPGNEDTMQSQHEQRDWYRYTLDVPMAREPGGKEAVYCSAGINLLGGIISQATGVWLPEFFDTYVAKPLQIRDYHINLMPTGNAYLAGGIYLRPRDMLKLGQLYLSNGRWNGKQIVAPGWVAMSTERHSAFAPDHLYGFGWHLHEMTVAGHSYREYAAEGNGGQFVIVLPELDLAVVIVAGNYGEFKTWYPLQHLVEEFVIPAATGALSCGSAPCKQGATAK
ncbi:MAG: serine hydrolase domain-containing protein, partial [Dokdonella sp.]